MLTLGGVLMVGHSQGREYLPVRSISYAYLRRSSDGWTQSGKGVFASQEHFLCLPYGGVLMAGQSGSMP